MKKLLFVLGAVACAASLQAASIKWYTNNNSMYLYGKDYAGGFDTSKTAASGTFYLLNLTADGALDSINTALVNSKGQVSAISSYVLGTGAVGASAKSGSSTTPNVATPSGFSAGDKVYTAILFMDESTRTADGVWYAISSKTGTQYTLYDETDASAAAAANKLSFSKSGTTTGQGYKFAGSAVPEPTSAMLLLLGVAGLALRRRRA